MQRLPESTTFAVILSIIAIVGGLILNFQEFLSGSPANAKNLIVTFLYMDIWCFLLVVAAKSKNRKVLMYCSVFWIMTLIFSVITIYVNATEASVDWAIPFVALLSGQFYGINYFTNDFLTSSIIIAVISLAVSAVALLLFRRSDTVVRN